METRLDAALVHLAGGRTVVAAAALAGVGARTLHRHLLDPSVQRRLRSLRQKIQARVLDQVVGDLARGTALVPERVAG